MSQGYAILELIGIPDDLHTDKNAQAIYILLNHKKISLHDDCIRSEYTALITGCLPKIRLPFYTIFYRTFKKDR
jgi:hypothetical protein